MSESFKLLGQEVRDALGEGPPEAQLAWQRERVLANASSPRPRRYGRWLALGFAAAVAAGATAVVLGWLPWPGRAGVATITCQDESGRDVHVGQWLNADDEQKALEFSEGTHIQFAADSRGRLEEVSAQRVRLSLESGTMHSAVAKGHGVSWYFRAGPYQVEVLGTELSITWRPETEHFVVEVAKGRVSVEGGQLEDEGIVIVAGQRFEAWGIDEEETLLDDETAHNGRSHRHGRSRRARRAAARKARLAAQQDRDANAKDESDDDDVVEDDDTAQEPEPLTWQDLARQSRWREAAALIDDSELDGLLSTLSAHELALLADVYRYAHRRAPATRVLLKLRERFPEHAAAKTAAFYLGRLSADKKGSRQDWATAAQWFRTALREAPRGALASEARGRLMEALQRAGDLNGARVVAQQYLQLHPTGPYQKLAEHLLQ